MRKLFTENFLLGVVAIVAAVVFLFTTTNAAPFIQAGQPPTASKKADAKPTAMPPPLPIVDKAVDPPVPPERYVNNRPFGRYASFEEMPFCDSSFDHVTPEKAAGEPDFNADPTCRLRTLKTITDTMEFDVQSAAPDASVEYWAVNLFDCNGFCGGSYPSLTEVYGSFSAQAPTLEPAESWANFSLANRMHFGDFEASEVVCFGGYHPPNVSIGLQIGATVSGFTSGPYMRLFWEKFLGGGNCAQNITTTTVSPATALTMKIEQYDSGGSRYWKGSAWINSTWSVIFNQVVLSSYDASGIDAGLEIYAADGDIQNMHVPMNFVHKLRIKYNGTIQPWDNNALHANIDSNSTTPTSLLGTWNVYDIIPGNYTSIAADSYP